MVFSEFSRLNYAYIVDTDKRDLLMVVEEIRHTESQNSEFFWVILCLLNFLSSLSADEVQANMALRSEGGGEGTYVYWLKSWIFLTW